jgi:electron transfer flavoprotein beta subunit
MNIIVCIKQVPDTTEIRMDPVTNTLVRSGVPSVINPFDRHALEAAVSLRDKYGGTVTAVTMGPPQAAEALRESYALGADRMVLINDVRFSGSDTYATSYILAESIKLIGRFDLIICGKQAIDGDTAQVGPALAEQLGIPQLTYVRKIELSGGRIRVERELDDCYEAAEAPLPVLLTVVKSINDPRLPNVVRKLRANRMEPDIISGGDIADLDPNRIGLAGSPTKVFRTFAPVRARNTVMIDGSQADAAVKRLLSEFDGKKIAI